MLTDRETGDILTHVLERENKKNVEIKYKNEKAVDKVNDSW